jgi:chromosome segregation ATPase
MLPGFRMTVYLSAAAALCLFCIWGTAYAQKSEFGKEAVQDLDESLSKLRKERDKLRDEISHLRTEKLALAEEMNLRIEEVESRAGELNKELDEANAKIEGLKLEKAELSDKLKDARLRLDKYDGKFNAKDAVFMQVKDENDRLKKDLANAEIVMQRSAERIQKLKREKESAEKELETTKKRLAEYFADQDIELSEIKGQREDLQRQIKVLSEKLKAAEEARQTAVLEARTLRDKLSAQAAEASVKEAKLKKDMTGASGREAKESKKTAAALAQAEKKLKEADRKIDELQRQNDVSQAMMELANEKLKYYVKTFEELKKKKPESSCGTSAALEVCQQENEALKAQLTALSEDHKKTLDEVASFKKTAREAQQALEAPKVMK